MLLVQVMVECLRLKIININISKENTISMNMSQKNEYKLIPLKIAIWLELITKVDINFYERNSSFCKNFQK